MHVLIPLSRQEYLAARVKLPALFASVDGPGANEQYEQVLSAYFPSNEDQLWKEVAQTHGMSVSAVRMDPEYPHYVEELLRERMYAAVPRVATLFNDLLGQKVAWVEVVTYVRDHVRAVDLELTFHSELH